MQKERLPAAGLTLRLLGPLTVSRDTAALALPRSRKTRALLGYLVVAARAVSRGHLCELLWDSPGDPRGELRWCLSKLRAVLDEPGRPRVIASGDGVAVDLSDCRVDVSEVLRALREGVATLLPDRLEMLAALFGENEFLEGLDLPHSPSFAGWLIAERRRFRTAHAAVLDHWVQALPVDSETALGAVERWLAIAPFDRHAHVRLLEALASRGSLREGDEHLAAVAKLYETEGQDWGAICHAWQAARARHAGGPAVHGAVVSGVSAPTAAQPAAESPMPCTARRASLAVTPFLDLAPGAALRGGLGDGMTHDIIVRLSKLRSMFVIAPGTMFALAERRIDADAAGRRLDVDYVASGALRRGPGTRLSVTVQLTETRSAQVVWAEEFSGRLEHTFEVVDEIGNRIVTAIAHQIEVAERNRAVLKHPNSLDAWEAHHRGLWHMFRFHREHNDQARHFFQAAVRLDPTFARPYAGLSFTYFQDAFQDWSERDAAIERAYAAAAEGVMADELDPAAHWALGRALWLKDREDDAMSELHAAVDLSPSFALGHYTLAFVNAQSGDARAAIGEADRARALSPLDPLLFGMLGSRALALLRLGRYDEAADCAVRSAAQPNAHVHIHAIAMFCLALAGRTGEAADVAVAIRRTQARYGLDDFLRAFKLGPDAEALVRKAAAIIERHGPSQT